MSGRYYLDDVPYEQALARWREALRAAGCPQRVEAERLPLAAAAGRVTADAVWALRSSPAFDAAAMDGIAVRAEQTAGASDVAPLVLPDDEIVVVDTGDPLPPGTDAVVMHEHARRVEGGVELRSAAVPYEHVRPIGEDIAATELVVPEGERLRPVDLAAAAAVGVLELEVRRRPLVAVLPSGDELVPLGVEPGPGELQDTNSLMLAAQAEAAGCEALALPICPDDPDALAAQVRAAAALADLVLVVAGSSAGRDDHTAAVVERVGTLVTHGVAVKPGHPVVLGVVDGTPLVGVPGYPVSAALTFELFAAPLLAELQGVAVGGRERVRVRLARKLASSLGMDDWVRVRVGRVGDRLVAAPLARGAGVLTSLVRADGLLLVPAGTEGYPAGADVDVELLRDRAAVERTLVVVGSHDPVLDLAASRLRRLDPGATLASSHVGSLGGLVALRDGLCHVAGSHLLDPRSGEYTLPFVDDLMTGRSLAVVRLVHREQGLLVPPGNPRGLRGVADLAGRGVRFVNRQRGAGTRILLDHLLGELGIEPAAIDGYAREAYTHLAVAAAVAAGQADCGLGLRAAADAFGLAFVPVAEEPYDLVLDDATLDHPVVELLLGLLADGPFRAEVERLGGYRVAESGRRLR